MCEYNMYGRDDVTGIRRVQQLSRGIGGRTRGEHLLERATLHCKQLAPRNPEMREVTGREGTYALP